MDEILSRKEKERLFRRNEILSASATLFAKKGFNRTTIDEISEAAEFGKGTIYNYFENKEEIYKSILDEMLNGNLDLLKESSAKYAEIEEFLTNYTKNLFKFCLDNKESFALLIRELSRIDSEIVPIDRLELLTIMTEMHEILLNRFRQAAAEGHITEFTPEELVMYFNHFIYPMLQALLHCEMASGVGLNQPERLLKVFFRGIFFENNGVNL